MDVAAFMRAKACAFPSRAIDEAITRVIRGRPARPTTAAVPPLVALRALMNKLSPANAARLLPQVKGHLAAHPDLEAAVLDYAANNSQAAALLVPAAVDTGSPHTSAFVAGLTARAAAAHSELRLPPNAEEEYEAFCEAVARKAELIGMCGVVRRLGQPPPPQLTESLREGVLAPGNAFASEVMLSCLVELGCLDAAFRRRVCEDRTLPFKLRFLCEQA